MLEAFAEFIKNQTLANRYIMKSVRVEHNDRVVGHFEAMDYPHGWLEVIWTRRTQIDYITATLDSNNRRFLTNWSDNSVFREQFDLWLKGCVPAFMHDLSWGLREACHQCPRQLACLAKGVEYFIP